MATQESSTDVGDLLCLIVRLLLPHPITSSLNSPTPTPTLSLQLDLNPLAWHLSAQPTTTSTSTNSDSLSLEQALEHILIFGNAHLSLRHENQLAVFAAGFGKRYILHVSLLEITFIPLLPSLLRSHVLTYLSLERNTKQSTALLVSTHSFHYRYFSK